MKEANEACLVVVKFCGQRGFDLPFAPFIRTESIGGPEVLEKNTQTIGFVAPERYSIQIHAASDLTS
jgi:hypothetical protein